MYRSCPCGRTERGRSLWRHEARHWNVENVLLCISALPDFAKAIRQPDVLCLQEPRVRRQEGEPGKAAGSNATLTVRGAALHVLGDVECDGPKYLDGGEQIRLRAAKLAAPIAHVARIGDVDLRIEGLRGQLLHVGSPISARTSRTLPMRDATAMPTPTSVAAICRYRM